MKIVSSLDLSPDSKWDEIALQVMECSGCGFRGVAVYEESRRGALGSEVVEHRGHRHNAPFVETLVREIATCPEPRNPNCPCAIHQRWNGCDTQGYWLGLPRSKAEFSILHD